MRTAPEEENGNPRPPLVLVRYGSSPIDSAPSSSAPLCFGSSPTSAQLVAGLCSGSPSSACDPLPFASSPCCNLAYSYFLSCPLSRPRCSTRSVRGCSRELPVSSGCRHPELPTRSWDLPFGTWGVVGLVGGAVFGSHLSVSPPFYL